jgi:hypothetical protein
MTDDELRALVREAVARHLGRPPTAPGAPVPSLAAAPGAAPALAHPSHVMYLTLVNDGEACVIEPAVACNHCGYCKSHGH